jgi:hypothetical protein
MRNCASEVRICDAPRNDSRNLLPVLGQHFIAGPAEPGAMLLETAQNNIIAIIHHGPAIARHIARAGIVPLLGRGRGSRQGKRNHEKNSDHLVTPYLSQCARSDSAVPLMSMRPRVTRITEPRPCRTSGPDPGPSRFGNRRSVLVSDAIMFGSRWFAGSTARC